MFAIYHGNLGRSVLHTNIFPRLAIGPQFGNITEDNHVCIEVDPILNLEPDIREPRAACFNLGVEMGYADWVGCVFEDAFFCESFDFLEPF